MEEVEQFDNISIEELAEGDRPSASYFSIYTQISFRTSREQSSICDT